MAGQTAGSIRARVRAEMTDEIKRIARRHLATDGANLSLRAVARDLGVVSSALYRYFASRDELLTALILDAYNALGEASETGDASVTDRSDLTGRWLATANAIRSWAVEFPHEYALIYGSPVPGYVAPQDTVGPAARPTVVFTTLLVEGHARGVIKAPRGDRLPSPVRADVAALLQVMAPGLPASIMARGMVAWTELFGAISFELFGRLHGVIYDYQAWYDHQMRAMAEYVGLPT
jgi:AcrR family transcriptional regulator